MNAVVSFCCRAVMGKKLNYNKQQFCIFCILLTGWMMCEWAGLKRLMRNCWRAEKYSITIICFSVFKDLWDWMIKSDLHSFQNVQQSEGRNWPLLTLWRCFYSFMLKSLNSVCIHLFGTSNNESTGSKSREDTGLSHSWAGDLIPDRTSKKQTVKWPQVRRWTCG